MGKGAKQGANGLRAESISDFVRLAGIRREILGAWCLSVSILAVKPQIASMAPMASRVLRRRILMPKIGLRGVNQCDK